MKCVGIAILLALVACGPSDSRGTDAAGGGGGGGGGGGSNGSGNQDNCSDSAKLVYVVDESNQFSKFDPSTKTFTDLGTLSCPTAGGIFGGASPFSMGVDRNTIAWVLYSDGELFRVDIQNNLACTKTSWASSNGLMQFGMGFSTDQPGGTTDTLFVAGGTQPTSGTPTSATLAKLDTGSMSAQTVGTVAGWPELTGTGLAELWGWFPDPNNPRVEQIDKTSGAAVPGKTYPLASLKGNPMAWAFAFWGGDYWVFLERDTETSTNVYQIDGMMGTIKSTTPTNTRIIVGAGVSTCAPVVIQ